MLTLKSVYIYSISTGINRGATLFYLPLVLQTLTLAEFGLYSIVQTTVQLLIPIISLGGGAAILREGSENAELGFGYLYKFIQKTLLIGTIGISLSFYLDHTNVSWVSFTIVLSTIEAVHLLLLTLIRSLDRSSFYFTFSALKALGLFIVIWGVHSLNLSLFSLLLGQVICYVVLSAVYLISISSWTRALKFTSITNVSIMAVLPYTLPLIPHSISQWIMSSSDRFIIKAFLGDIEVGIYSIAYTFALVIMLLNSGLALALPQYVIQNYEIWKSGVRRCYFIKIYSILVSILVMFLLAVIEIDKYTTNFITDQRCSLTILFLWITAGLYLLGIYYFYVNFNFYHKKTGEIAKQTGIAAMTNIVLTMVFVPSIGIEGAAIATFLSYLEYLILIVISAIKEEAELLEGLWNDLQSVLLTILFFAIVLTWYYFKLCHT